MAQVRVLRKYFSKIIRECYILVIFFPLFCRIWRHGFAAIGKSFVLAEWMENVLY